MFRSVTVTGLKLNSFKKQQKNRPIYKSARFPGNKKKQEKALYEEKNKKVRAVVDRVKP